MESDIGASCEADIYVTSILAKDFFTDEVIASFDAKSEFESSGSDAEGDSGDIMRMPVHHVQR